MSVTTRVVLAVSCVALAACALITDLGGLASDGGIEGSAACEAGGACAALQLPAGWTPIAFHEDFVGCPMGFDSRKFIIDPTATCGCACSVTAPPSCEVGNVATSYGVNCTSQGLAVSANNGACVTISGMLDTHFAAQPVAPAGGACSPTDAVADASARSAEACIPQACSDDLCRGVVPPGYKACVLADGEVPCPAATPFSVPTTLGTSSTSNCVTACTCTPTGTCSSPTITFYSDTSCNAPVIALPANGTCQLIDAGGATVKSAKYAASAVGVCTASGPGSGDASLAGLATVCCAP